METQVPKRIRVFHVRSNKELAAAEDNGPGPVRRGRVKIRRRDSIRLYVDDYPVRVLGHVPSTLVPHEGTGSFRVMVGEDFYLLVIVAVQRAFVIEATPASNGGIRFLTVPGQRGESAVLFKLARNDGSLFAESDEMDVIAKPGGLRLPRNARYLDVTVTGPPPQSVPLGEPLPPVPPRPEPLAQTVTVTEPPPSPEPLAQTATVTEPPDAGPSSWRQRQRSDDISIGSLRRRRRRDKLRLMAVDFAAAAVEDLDAAVRLLRENVSFSGFTKQFARFIEHDLATRLAARPDLLIDPYERQVFAPQ